MRWPLILLLLLILPLFFFGGPDYYSVLLLVGLTIELIQLGLDDRCFSWSDLLRDLSGGATFLLWRLSTSVSYTQSILYKVASIFILIANLIPLGGIASDEYRSHKYFPLLAGFENKSSLSRWDGNAELRQSAFVSRQGSHSGKIILTLDKYSGLFLNHFPGDWSRMEGLAFNIFNPGSQIVLHYRVHDNLHRGDRQLYSDRFNGKSVLTTGWNEIIIPITDILSGPQERVMDLTQISSFGVFVIRQDERRVLYIDNVRLLKF